MTAKHKLRVSETFDDSVPHLKPEKNSFADKHNNPIVRIDLDEMSGHDGKFRNPYLPKNSSKLRSQISPETEIEQSAVSHRRYASSNRSKDNNELAQKTYSEIAKEKRIINKSRGVTDTISQSSQYSNTNTRQRKKSIRSPLSINPIHQTSNLSLKQSPRVQQDRKKADQESIFMTTDRNNNTSQKEQSINTTNKNKRKMTTLSEEDDPLISIELVGGKHQ